MVRQSARTQFSRNSEIPSIDALVVLITSFFSVLVRYAGTFSVTNGLHAYSGSQEVRLPEVSAVTGPKSCSFCLPFLYIHDRDIISFKIQTIIKFLES